MTPSDICIWPISRAVHLTQGGPITAKDLVSLIQRWPQIPIQLPFKTITEESITCPKGATQRAWLSGEAAPCEQCIRLCLESGSDKEPGSAASSDLQQERQQQPSRGGSKGATGGARRSPGAHKACSSCLCAVSAMLSWPACIVASLGHSRKGHQVPSCFRHSRLHLSRGNTATENHLLLTLGTTRFWKRSDCVCKYTAQFCQVHGPFAL